MIFVTHRIKIVVLLLAVFFNEYLIYKLQRLKWDVLPCNICTRILFVADPQILGDEHEFALARFDSDRHLHRTYKEAVDHVDPDVIIFLGDLMDEGSIADDKKFIKYYKRFGKIFPVSDSVFSIHIPGDNDIGGEGGEIINKVAVRRFANFFTNETSWKVNNIEIFHVNRITGNIQDFQIKDLNSVKIIISHYPVIHFPNKLSKSAITRIRPNMIFSSHNHKSMIFQSESVEDFYPKSFELTHTVTFDLNTSTDIHEIQVPAASYRMGMLRIGYGQAVIGKDSLTYAPMFVISRFYQFLLYGVLVLIYLIVIFSLKVLRIFMKKRRRYRRLTTEEH